MLTDAPARNHGSCFRRNKYPVHDDEYNYHDSVQARLKERISHKHCHIYWAIEVDLPIPSF